MTHVVKFCPNNFTGELGETKQRVRECDDTEVVERLCLNYCGQCIVQPFAIVNGKGVFCDQVDELYPAIMNRLGQTVSTQ
ncbi:DUF1450 domain-containing protein [Jeotgalibacillus sp. R-1-5s-1]|uniref:DUF1450 domain-containing protein n=1 Tax=Jeotgalibacillus sp. R-1-5s-1 TaxID=2555897 RepID=UPI00141B1C5A|nr:DUF1450 domain-containing protein [Jeotgalibacillus sp. R-1-5s-1]